MSYGAIVLCGGKSRRMGHAKATLPFGEELLLQRVVRLVRQAAMGPTVVVAAQGQELPELPQHVMAVRDRRPDRGPLEGLATGLARLGQSVEAAYATSCDAPLLTPAFVRRMFHLAEGYLVAVPRAAGYDHPLAAVYRPAVLPEIEKLLAADRLRPAFLFERVPTRVVEGDELRDIDPRLDSLRNVNHPEDYLAALADAGLTAPADILQKLGLTGS